MVVKVYVSASSGNFEVKKHQQRIETVLESVGVRHDVVDVCAPEHLDDRLFMQSTARAAPGDAHPLPPQIYNEQRYCGDFEDFDYANETGQLLQFLRLEEGDLSLPVRSAPPRPAPELPTTTPQNGFARLRARPAVPPQEPEQQPPAPPVAPVPPPPAPSPEPQPTEPAHQARHEPWEIDRSGADCLHVDKEAWPGGFGQRNRGPGGQRAARRGPVRHTDRRAPRNHLTRDSADNRAGSAAPVVRRPSSVRRPVLPSLAPRLTMSIKLDFKH